MQHLVGQDMVTVLDLHFISLNRMVSIYYGYTKLLVLWVTLNLNYHSAGIYDSAHLIFHGPSVRRKISVK